MIESSDKACIASPAEGEVTTGEAQFPNGTAPDPLTFWYDAAKAAQTENASLRAKLAERDQIVKTFYGAMQSTDGGDMNHLCFRVHRQAFDIFQRAARQAASQPSNPET